MTFALRMLAFLVTFWIASTPFSQADQSVSIRTLLNSASPFQHHTVTVLGIVKDRQDFPPVYGKNCGILYDSYILHLRTNLAPFA